MREITGKELEKTLLKTQGRTWDGIALPKLKISDLKKEAIDYFKEKAIMRGRLTKEELDVEDDILMDNLRLIDEDGYLCRAAMLAFYKDPEKWVFGAYIKIGFFGKSDSDLIYQDEIHGPLIEQVDKTLDLIYTKYLKALIYYKGIQRIEQFMFHKDALREILLNAVVHKDYRTCNPIQISVYNDKIYVYNDGEMPVGLDSTEKLFSKHSSKPFNPILANIFFKSGQIEAWGRGFDKIKDACNLYNGPLPEYEINESGVMVLCKACPKYLELLTQQENQADSILNVPVKVPVKVGVSIPKSIPNDIPKSIPNKTQKNIIEMMSENPRITQQEIAEKLNLSIIAIKKSIKVLTENQLIERTGSARNGYWKVK